MTPTARTLAWLRAQGATADVVERRIPHSFVTKDLFGFLDILALEPGKAGVLGVQTTSNSNMAARVKKINGEPRSALWRACGNRIQVIGWAKRGPRGRRKVWTASVTDVGVASPAAPREEGT